MFTVFHYPVVLTVAGLDPSGCAGILADIKTFEAHGVYGMAVCTANSRQSASKFEKPNWISADEITGQLALLQQERSFDYVKIGLVENMNVLKIIVEALFDDNNEVRIIWDPVAKASSATCDGEPYNFFTNVDQALLKSVCTKLYLVTPNFDEIKLLAPGQGVEEAGKYLSQFCHVLLKGGHSGDFHSTDVLFMQNEVYRFEAERLNGYYKRGTGCVLSAAIAANLARGFHLVKACEEAKNYVTAYLTSNRSQIGLHKYAHQ